MSTEDFFVDILLVGGYYLIIGTVIIAILSAIVGASNDPKGAVKGLVGMGLVLGLLFIAFSTASPDNPSKNVVTDNISKWVEGGIVAVLIMTLSTFALMIASMIKDIFN